MISTLLKLLDLIRFSHTIFALPFAMISVLLAWQVERFRELDLVGILLCMVMARSAAMAFNRLVDRRIDAQNPRTAQRHLPAGTLTLPTVIVFTIVTSLLFIAATCFFLFREPANEWPLLLSAPVLLFLLMYSLTKRFTSLAHFWLGIALCLAPIAAWIAVMGRIDVEPVLLGLAVLFWVSGFDIIYACQDADFDRNAGLFSVPARFGVHKSLRIAAVCHAIMLAFLIALGLVSTELHIIYDCGLVAIAILLIYEHSLVKADNLTRVNQAFFQVNAVISLGLLGLVVVQLLANQFL